MPDRSRSRRSPARYLAPLALAATIAGAYLIVSGSVNNGSSPSTSAGSGKRPTGTTTTTSTSTTRGSGTGTLTSSQTTGPASAYYLVRSGDTLSVIALRNHLTVTALEELNPGVSANALRVGERLRLRQ